MILKQKTARLFKTLFALMLVSVFAVTVLAACAGEEGTESQGSVAESSAAVNESSKTEIIESSVDESSESENAESSVEENSDNSDSSAESSENDESSVPDEESSEPETSTPDEESSEPIIEPEIVGAGTKDDPYLIIPSEDMKLTTYEIGSDETQYYGIYRIGGLDATVNSEDLYIACDGKKYTPKDGVLQFRVINAMPSDAIVLEITNTSTAKQCFEITFTNPVGTYANPVEINLGKDFKVSLPENNEVGYYYKHTAEKDGVIIFKFTATADGFLSVTNNRSYAQRTTDEDGSVGDNGEKYVEIEVLKGDELVINAGGLPNKRGKRPAIDITVSGEYK